MARIRIKDLNMDHSISLDELKRVFGGTIAGETSFQSPLENSFPVMFNPEEITIKKTIPWQDQKTND